MIVAFVGEPPSPALVDLAARLRGEIESDRTHLLLADADAARLVFNVTTADAPRAHWRRRSTEQFGVTLLACARGALGNGAGIAASDVLALAYPALLKTLSNAVVATDGARVVLVTPEMGVRALAPDAGAVLDAILPLATARLAIRNRVREDLPPSLESSPAIAQLAGAGRRLAALGLLPSPVALDGILAPEDRRLLHALFGVTQLSYGNASIREPSGGFWMTGRGVDKSRVGTVGRDVFLVSGHDVEAGTIEVRVPAGRAEGLVSVDAIEHALAYEALPGVGAIVHVHAWMDGIEATRQSYPCGTVELAREVVGLLARQPDPSSACVGLRNHGLTLTGKTLPAIFERMDGRLVRDVPPT